jgi:hypothetical protein
MSWSSQLLNGGTPIGQTGAPGAVGHFGRELTACVWTYGGHPELHVNYIDADGDIQDIAYMTYGITGSPQTLPWRWQYTQVTNVKSTPSTPVFCKEATVPAMGNLCATVYGNQLHISYISERGYIQDVFIDSGNPVWKYQQINGAGGVVQNGPLAGVIGQSPSLSVLCVSVYNDQQHFAYVDTVGNVQDIWYDGHSWHLQQINNAGGRGPTSGVESICCPGATAQAAMNGLYVSSFNDQQHFAYQDTKRTIQDVWWNGSDNKWSVQQITGGATTVAGEYCACDSAPPPGEGGDLVIGVYNKQQHFIYGAANGNIHDVWWSGDTNKWSYQQINNANGGGASVRGTPICYTGATAALNGKIVVNQYTNQQHIAYLDHNGGIQDVWWDGDKNVWNLQQLNGPATVAGEYLCCESAPPAEQNVAVTSWSDSGSQVFVYQGPNQSPDKYVNFDNTGEINTCWYRPTGPSSGLPF